MQSSIIESFYPITFRKEDAKKLGEYLKHRESVNLIGMRRVGISNFLRFFLNHKDITNTYISSSQHLFIVVDLNDLIEREIFPLWILTFKRIVDSVEKTTLSEHVKKYIEGLFLDNMQTKDLFLTIDAIRKSLLKIIENGFLPDIFFLRFDRIKDAVTPEFYANLQGLRDACHRQLAYVFTSYRSLDALCPEVFTRNSLTAFSQEVYIKPAKRKDIEIIYKIYNKKHTLSLSPQTEQALFNTVDGYVQYLQLALVLLHEESKKIKDKENLLEKLTNDERVNLQSEELWETLTETEQKVLLKICKKEDLEEAERSQAKYLWDTGLISKDQIFSLLFDYYLKHKEVDKTENGVNDFTKKENQLFSFLQNYSGEICERESIIEAVWPEVEALGVTDWAIDRLIARVRSKLEKQTSAFRIITVKTRGYKLQKISY